MSGANGGSFGSASMHVGAGSAGRSCHTYSGASLPSLYVHAGQLEHVGLPVRRHDHRRSRALLAPSWPRPPRQFAAECARMHDAAQASTAGTTAA